MSLRVKLHWAERFLNWYPHNTRLYLRKKKGQEPHFSRDGKELFDQLAPFLDKLKEEAYQEGYLASLKDYAIWNDGVEYVGCGNHTLKQAQQQFVERNENLTRMV